MTNQYYYYDRAIIISVMSLSAVLSCVHCRSPPLLPLPLPLPHWTHQGPWWRRRTCPAAPPGLTGAACQSWPRQTAGPLLSGALGTSPSHSLTSGHAPKKKYKNKDPLQLESSMHETKRKQTHPPPPPPQQNAVMDRQMKSGARFHQRVSTCTLYVGWLHLMCTA